VGAGEVFVRETEALASSLKSARCKLFFPENTKVAHVFKSSFQLFIKFRSSRNADDTFHEGSSSAQETKKQSIHFLAW
jgi:hypothetical protein